MIGPEQAATRTAAATTVAAKPKDQGTVPGWSTIRPATAPPAELPANGTVASHVLASLRIPAGTMRPTMAVYTVSAGAIVMPPMASAAPSANGPGITASSAVLTATDASSQPNCRDSGTAMRSVPYPKPPMTEPSVPGIDEACGADPESARRHELIFNRIFSPGRCRSGPVPFV